MPTREELITQAKQKWEREQLVALAKQKWAAENSAPTQTQGQQEEQGLIEQAGGLALKGVAKVGETIDRYSGAPTRAAIASLQDGNGLSGAARSFGSQFGEDPHQAPSGQDIAIKAGVPNKEYTFHSKEPAPNDPDFYRYMNDPLFRDQYHKTGKGSEYVINPSKDLGFVVEMGADPLNILPVGAAAKSVVGSAAKGMSKLGKGSQIAGQAISKTGSKLVTKVGNVFTGIPEQEIATYLNKYPDVQKLITQYGDDMPGAADKIREGFQSSIRLKRQELGTKVRKALDSLPNEKVVDIEPVTSQLKLVRDRMNKSLRLEEVKQVDELIERISGLADESGKVTPKEMFDIKEFLQDRGSGAFMKEGQIFVPGKDAQIAAKNASREARQLVNTMSPTVAEGNRELSKLHILEKKINKNLIASGTPDSALAAAGSGANPRNAKNLQSLGEVTGKDMLGEAQKFASARRFSSPSWTAADSTGKGVERLIKTTIPAAVFGGPTAALVAGAATSPMALKVAVQAGRIPISMVQKLSGVTGKVTDEAFTKAYHVLKTPAGQKAVKAAMQGAKAAHVGEINLSKVAQGKDDSKREPSSLKGEALWIQKGVEKLGLDKSTQEKLMNSKRGRQLLIEASDLKQGSPAMEKIKIKIKKEFGG